MPPWKARLLNRLGRLILTKSTFTAIVLIHISILVELQAWAIRAIDKIRKAFLWGRIEVVNCGHYFVARTKAYRPMKLGGLGPHDLKLLGFALWTLHWEWLRRTDLPKSSQGSRSHMNKVAAAVFEAASLSVRVGNGPCTLFWRDKWFDNRSIFDIAPTLHTLVSMRIRNSRTVKEALSNHRWV